jgi:hypothetical protein
MQRSQRDRTGQLTGAPVDVAAISVAAVGVQPRVQGAGVDVHATRVQDHGHGAAKRDQRSHRQHSTRDKQQENEKNEHTKMTSPNRDKPAHKLTKPGRKSRPRTAWPPKQLAHELSYLMAQPAWQMVRAHVPSLLPAHDCGAKENKIQNAQG